MHKNITNLCKNLIISAAVALVAAPALAAAPVNARGGDATTARNSGRVTGRTDATEVKTNASTAARTARHSGAITSRMAANDTVRTTATNSRSAIRANAASAPRSATAVDARSATKPNMARSATMMNSRGGVGSANVSNVSRAATARATAIFNDISKIGSGYAACREAYATCMDQLCANANDTYRRCFCSDKFVEFRNTEAALDEAKNLLMRFEDNNLNAVDKTAAEVAAMYSASEGEMAIKNDTSAAAAMLAEIGDLLSGKKKTTPTQTSGSLSLGIMDIDFSADVDDIWAGGGSSIFGGGTAEDLTALEGIELYNRAHQQCSQLVADTCENNAVFSMARSSYSILISQDCNAYQKSLNSKRNAVEQTVRTAEKYLREARLEEYRSHNSADVNECLSKVRSALLADTACGSNYKRCLDYTGAYISQTTGEPIYSPKLFKLQELINLPGLTDDNSSSDILTSNPEFNAFLEDRKMFATTALDTCRDISDIVWNEFKRTAMIEISQAQDEKIEEVKSSCVSTMKECYDTQSEALKSFDETTAQATGALTAYASKAMCEEKVVACAALYGDADACSIDKNGKVTDSNKGKCGLAELLAFVDTVNDVRAAEGCASAIDQFVTDLCAPSNEQQKFPWGCRNLPLGNVEQFADVNAGSISTASLAGSITRFAVQNCSDPNETDKNFNKLQEQTQTQVRRAVADISEQLEGMFMDACEELNGFWVYADDHTQDSAADLKAFYSTVYGGQIKDEYQTWGRCVENTTRVQCLGYNSDLAEDDKGADSAAGQMASYNLERDECTFSDEWFRARCTMLGNGYYENGICYVIPEN